jgi:hypothetical protein
VAEIRHQQAGRGPASLISFSEIHIPDDADLGTGTYTVHFKPRSLPATDKPIACGMLGAPDFEIKATFTPDGELSLALGSADDSRPKRLVSFVLPSRIDPTDIHLLVVSFTGWEVTAAALDDVWLPRKS